ncbi:MAG: RDD family protein, partial [Pyrinomonadaceae bacterium]
ITTRQPSNAQFAERSGFPLGNLRGGVMALCPSCHSEVPAGSRWCSVCHANVAGSSTHLASPGKRLGAYTLDIAIPFFAFLLMLGAAGVAKSLGFGFLLLVVYAIWAMRLFAHGTTPGKKLLGIRVVRENGQEAGFGVMLVRELIGKAISGLIFALGYLWILLDRDRQGWHDKLVSTYVVQ